MTKKEQALIDELEILVMNEIFANQCTLSGIIFLTKMNDIIFKLKFPKLNTKNIEIQ